MPGTRCAVAVCSNSLQETKKKNSNISYHTFPKNQKLCDVWINACRKKDKWNHTTSTICSVHFLEKDF
ncbi:THAP domain-containing protein 2-like, partial [Aphis craccivora]